MNKKKRAFRREISADSWLLEVNNRRERLLAGDKDMAVDQAAKGELN